MAHGFVKGRVSARRSVTAEFLVDTGATYSIVPPGLAHEVGAPMLPQKFVVSLADGTKRRLRACSIGVTVAGHDNVVLNSLNVVRNSRYILGRFGEIARVWEQTEGGTENHLSRRLSCSCIDRVVHCRFDVDKVIRPICVPEIYIMTNSLNHSFVRTFRRSIRLRVKGS